MIDVVLSYFQTNGMITIGVLLFLSIYLMLTIWIFIYKYLELNSSINQEINSLDSLISGESNMNPLSSIGQYIGNSAISKELLEVCEISLIREASSGLSWQSIISSTAPFIGLFGTVVGILESFSKFATSNKVSFAVIAPVISEALVATAAGIFVAIFAYTFHQIITRKVYELNTYLKAQSKIILSED
jgi:biopolymer transport protein ExbB/TolQ